jgi:hypothetical protein
MMAKKNYLSIFAKSKDRETEEDDTSIGTSSRDYSNAS